jgi:uncharacterized membrane protein (UPF0127 family)
VEISLPLGYVRAMRFHVPGLIFLLLLTGPPCIGDSALAQQGQPCYPSNRGMETMESSTVVLVNDNGHKITLNSLVADDNLERASGYQYICPDVIDRTSILFRYPQPGSGRFHMHNVRAPLDIAFFDENGVLIQSARMQPYVNGEETLYGPMQAFQYALEVRAGFLAEHELSAGKSRLLLD